MLTGYAAEAMKRIEEHQGAHGAYMKKVDKRYRSYKGILRATDKAARWTPKLHPPLIFDIVETIVANLVEDKLAFKITPRPKVEELADVQTLISRARSIDMMVRYFHDLDDLQYKQRAHFLQQAIAGMSVAKNYWDYEEGPRRYLVTEETPIIHPLTGEPMGSTASKMVERYDPRAVVRDQPTFEVINVEDFIWHQAAVELRTAPFVAHRIWYTFDELKRLEDLGVYTNIDDLKDSHGGDAEGYSNRTMETHGFDRTKDMIEVWEYWDRLNQKVVSIGNRNVEIRKARQWPFYHGEYPFVVCSSMPDLFVLPGTSDVELVEELQQMLWTLMNQRVANLELINNFIMLVREDVLDPDGWEHAPGERWRVPDVDAVKPLEVDSAVAQYSLEAERMIRGDLQNVTGGMPFMSGTETTTMDQKTATGVSIITSLAQKRLAHKKQNVMRSMKSKVELDVKMFHQFVREPRVVQIVGRMGAPEFMAIKPEELQGEYIVEMEPVNYGFMQQEKRAQAQARTQILVELAPFLAATGAPLNMKAVAEDFLRDFDVMELERYFDVANGPNAAIAGIPGAGGMAPPQAPPQAPQGVTSPLASDVNSPSSEVSFSPVKALQQAGALTGGPVNA